MQLIFATCKYNCGVNIIVPNDVKNFKPPPNFHVVSHKYSKYKQTRCVFNPMGQIIIVLQHYKPRHHKDMVSRQLNRLNTTVKSGYLLGS